jgi:hypothetical protein
MIQKGIHTRMHINIACRVVKERERIVGAIVQGVTCLAAQTAQNLALEDLEDCPMLVHGNNNN